MRYSRINNLTRHNKEKVSRNNEKVSVGNVGFHTKLPLHQHQISIANVPIILNII